jgi:hypothetical protein
MTAGERTLNIETAHFRHMKVEHDTVRLVVLDGAQELRARRERFYVETGGGNESRQGNAHVCVVVHYSQQRYVVYHLDCTVAVAAGRSYWTLVQVSNAAQAR